ncbi:MAG: hypothetical protein AB1772_10490 [Candidatus Zixiibacteriota bacterium]
MRTFSLAALVAMAIAAGLPGSTLSGPGLSLKAGVGYEFFSQEFFLDSLAQAGADSLEITTALKTTYLDDLKAQVRIGYIPLEDYRLELDGFYEQTEDSYRLRGYWNHRPAFGPFRLDWNSEVDWRDGTPEVGEADPGYLTGSGRVKLAYPVTLSTSLWTRGKAEFVRFDSVETGAFNYRRFTGEIGTSYTTSNYSLLSFSGFFTRRHVPDSPEQEYQSIGLDASFLGFYTSGEIDILSRYESRDYNRSGNLDDYGRWDLDLRNRHNLSRRFFAREEIELELIAFDTTSYLTSTYRRIETCVMAGLTGESGSIAAGPRLELLRESQTESYLIAEDYTEYGIKAQFDFIRPSQVFGSLETVAGVRDRREVGTDQTSYSDFVFERLSLLGDWTPANGLSLNVLLSVDWEWHDNPDQNSRLVLLTSNLVYAF